MPELPEVETIRLGLLPLIKGQEISGLKVLWAKTLQGTSVRKHIIGRKVTDIRRRGKVLILDLDNKYSLLVHLKMTGQMIAEPAKGERFAGGHPTKSMVSKLPDASTRVIFGFKNGSRLFFNDQRKFGWIKLVPTAEVELDSLVARLGPEPLEATFVFEDFYTQIKKRKAPIKVVILDQSTLAGIGNIYADEALHLAKIHPQRLGVSIKPTEAKKLFEAIKQVLKASLGYGGTTFTTYVNALGVKGNYLDYARVFRRQGQPCPVCGTKIQKIRVAGRGTHVCPKCQRIA